jgi:hypothetical protein
MARCKVCRCRPTDFPDEFQSSERWRSQCASRGSPAISSPSRALVRFDAIDAQQLLCRLFPRPIVASWHVMIAKILESGLVGRATVEHASIRGRNRSSSKSKSLSARQVAILSGWARERARPVAGEEAGRVGSTRVAEVRRSWPPFLGRVRRVAGKEIPRAGFERGGSSSRPGWFGSIRSSGARELRRCAGRRAGPWTPISAISSGMGSCVMANGARPIRFRERGRRQGVCGARSGRSSPVSVHRRARGCHRDG